MALQSPRQPLRDCSILVVEDDYFLAEELAEELAVLGARIVGPAASVEQALELIKTEPDLDAAVLDVNLRGHISYPVADALLARGVLFVFATGYDAEAIACYRHATRIEKPINFRDLGQALASALRLSP